MSIIISSILGIIAFFLILRVVNEHSIRRTMAIKESRDPFASIPYEFAVATIADDLIPLASPHISHETVIYMIGSDGHYVGGRNGKVLASGLQRWLESGATINYILLRPMPKSPMDKFDAIIDANPEKFRLHCVNYESCDQGFRDFLKPYIHEHPTLILNEKTDANAMWLEGWHEPGCEFAENVVFVAPDAMNSSYQEVFSMHLSNIHRILNDKSCSNRNHACCGNQNEKLNTEKEVA